MAYEVTDIAKYMVCIANEMHAPISNLKLQKLLYFAWKDYYKATNKALFNKQFEAWKFGPVIPEVYYQYCAYGPMPISSPLYQQYEDKTISAADASFLRKFLKKYEKKSVYELVQKTHQIGGAWDKVFQGGQGFRNTIGYDLIKADC